MDEQRQLIVDQFTRQAVPFAEMRARDDTEIHRLLIETAENTRSRLRTCSPGHSPTPAVRKPSGGRSTRMWA